MATEIASFPLKSGQTPNDANSSSGQVLKDTLSTLTEQKGFQRAYWGTELENPGMFRLFVDWDSVDDHIHFTKQDHYQPFFDRFGMMCDTKKAVLYHAHLQPHPATTVLSDTTSPACEILTVYFPTSYSSSDQETFATNWNKVLEAVEKNCPETYHGAAGGWVVEDLDVPSKDTKGKAYQALLGWKSMEDHISFTQTQAFKDVIHHLFQAKDLVHYTMTHFSGTEVQGGAGGVGDAGGGALPSAQGEVLNPQGGGGGQNAPKTRSDGTTTKNNDDLKGAANALHKDRAGR